MWEFNPFWGSFELTNPLEHGNFESLSQLMGFKPYHKYGNLIPL